MTSAASVAVDGVGGGRDRRPGGIKSSIPVNFPSSRSISITKKTASKPAKENHTWSTPENAK